MSLQDEIRQAAKEGAQEAHQPVQFPDVQNVKVTNWPEEKDKPEVEKVEVTNWPKQPDIKIEPQVNIPDVVVPPIEIPENTSSNAILSEIKQSIDSKEVDYDRVEEIFKKFDFEAAIKAGMKGFQSSGWLPVVSAVETYADNRLKHAFEIIQDTYSDTVSVSAKKKDLRKWGRNTAVGTARATIMTLPTGVTAETLLTEDTALSVSSSSGSDTSKSVVLVEGHTSSGTDLTFSSVNPAVTLTGQTAASLGFSRTRLTRARLSLPAVGDIYFYETGTTLDAGVPTDLTKVHMMIPAGEIQTQKASTSISSVDYWIITGAKAGVLSKTSAWAQVRIEIKPWTDTTNSWYPITEWISVSDASGTVSLFGSDEPYLIIPKNYDVRMSAIANTAGIDVTGGMIGYLAKVL